MLVSRLWLYIPVKYAFCECLPLKDETEGNSGPLSSILVLLSSPIFINVS